MDTHELKSWPREFQQIADGVKRFEVRLDDRGYAVEDSLILNEWDPATKEYTGRKISATVTTILRGRDAESPLYLTGRANGVETSEDHEVVVMGLLLIGYVTGRERATAVPAGIA